MALGLPILLLTETDPPAYDAVELAERLGYSKMTTSRVLNELLATEVNLVETVGRARKLVFDGNRQALWNRCLPFMDMPVRYRQLVISQEQGSITGIYAGLTALATRSMLAKPAITRIAVTSDQWTEIKERPDVELADVPSDDAVEMEMWSYDPALFAIDGICDPFSLCLSLRDEGDERVLSAIEEMMEGLRH